MSLKTRSFIGIAVGVLLAIPCCITGCGVYSMTGAATTAKTIQIEQFYNNTDLAPPNIAQLFTNSLKDYYQRNSSLRVIEKGGELQVEGVISEYRINPIAPQAGNPDANNSAALTRLTIGVKVSYVDGLEPKNSFKDKSFSFYKDFDNNENFTTIQEDLQKKIFEQILIDIFNATIGNW